MSPDSAATGRISAYGQRTKSCVRLGGLTLSSDTRDIETLLSEAVVDFCTQTNQEAGLLSECFSFGDGNHPRKNE